MLVDANRIETTDRLAGDVCIIGGGIAGITIAMKLAGRGIRVHLVEGGGRRYSRRSQSLYDGVAWDDRYSLCGTRARLLGGTSNFWSGWTRPFGPMDFGGRPWLGEIGWPIEERELAPYDAAASALLEVPPPEPDATLLASLDGTVPRVVGRRRGARDDLLRQEPAYRVRPRLSPGAGAHRGPDRPAECDCHPARDRPRQRRHRLGHGPHRPGRVARRGVGLRSRRRRHREPAAAAGFGRNRQRP